MLEVQPGVGRDKQVACAIEMPQFPDPIVAGTVNLMLRIVTNYGIDFSDSKF